MNSKEFVQACEDGKTLVWGNEGSRILDRKEKKLYYLDLVTGFALSFDRVEMCGDSNVFMMIGENPVGVIPTGSWDLLLRKYNIKKKEEKE